MSDATAPDEMGKTARTVQDYIDETPRWLDGTPTPSVPMTPMQSRIWVLASAGKFFEGLVVGMGGVALPLIAREFNLVAYQHGLVTAAGLLGILIGATLLGGLADKYGRKRMFVVEMAIFTLFLVGIIFSPNFGWLVTCLLGMGIALGCDYPTAHVVISESTPSRDRGKLVLSAFGFQAVGMMTAMGVGYLILANADGLGAWRWMYGTAIIPAVIVLVARLNITESAHWLMARDRATEAEREAKRLLHREPPYPKEVTLRKPDSHRDDAAKSYGALFKGRNRRATILASVPWFLQDLGTYGIGIFTPVILAASVGHKAEHPHNVAALIHNDMIAAKGAAMIDVLLVIGILFAVFLADRVGRIRLQTIGFVGCAVGLAIAAASTYVTGATQTLLIFAGFMLFNFMTNMGPNAQTYLIAGEVFPTHIRGKGAGFAASFAKTGAVTTAFLFPILLAAIGTQALLYILVGTSLLGAVVTLLFRIETAGVNLETIGHEDGPVSS